MRHSYGECGYAEGRRGDCWRCWRGRTRHGYELAKLIEAQSGQQLQFHVASLYPMLYRLERKGLVEGKWVEKAGERRKRYYKLTAAGRKSLAEQRKSWRAFVRALNQLTGFSHA
jgi:DNA-binding PadR family transcriptional regulator